MTMSDKVFLDIVNMSITGSFAILIIMLARLLLKKAPKVFSYALWFVAFFRLLVPVSFESVLSILPFNTTPLSTDMLYIETPYVETGIKAIDSVINPVVATEVFDSTANVYQIFTFWGKIIWFIGVCAFCLYSICFADSYTVETWKDGKCNTYDIAVSKGDSPFKILKHSTDDKAGHGTRISTFVFRHLPDATAMTDILSARFLYDPKFVVKINGKRIDLSQHKGVVFSKEFITPTKAKLLMTVVDSEKTAAKSQQHGIAFWVSGRLVGQPSWTYGKITFLDGRFKAAKRYTVIIKSDDLIDDVLPDWSGFIDSAQMESVYHCVKAEVDQFIKSVMQSHLSEVRLDVIKDVRDELETLNVTGQRNISAFIEKVTDDNPVITPDYLHSAVEAMISIEKAKKGELLLSQLGQMTPDQLDKLTDILSTWNVDDLATVIGEIDKRIVVIEAIQRIYNDKTTEELHTLHPLILNSKWLFGAQFDSPMFMSNSTLTTVVKGLFKDEDYDLDAISSPKRRPDIICLKQYSLKAVCTDRIDPTAGEIMKPDQILIVEVKRGGFEITDDEVNQVEFYVRQIRKSAVLHSSATIDAYVVGAKLGDIDPEKNTTSGRIHAVTYGQLVDTASGKLFRLRDRLKEHYDSLGQESIVEQALRDSKQLKMNI